MKTNLVIFLSFLAGALQAQTDFYDQLKVDYVRLRKVDKQDSALVIAKHMNAWALQNESDTSLRYAVSFRYVGNCFRSLNNFDAALRHYNLSLNILKKQKRKMHLDYANALNNLGDLYSDLGNYKVAEPYYYRELEICKKVFGEEHSEYANCLNNLAILYFDLGDFKMSEPYFKQALEIYKKSLGEAHPEYANCLNNLAILYSDMGDCRAAEPYYKQALEIYKKSYGEEHTDYVMCLNNLADLYYEICDYQAAEDYYLRVLEITKKSLGEEHPDYAINLNNLANVYLKKNDYKVAESYFKETLEIYKKSLGEEHPYYIMSLDNLAILYSAMVDYISSELFYKQALEIYKKIFGEEHQGYANCLMGLGNLYSDMGDYKAAEFSYKHALNIFKKSLGKEHTDYAMCLNNLGLLYSNMGNYKAAELYYNQTLNIVKKSLGVQHPEYAKCLNNLGNLYSDLGDYKVAEPYYKETLDIYKKSLGEAHLDYSMSLNNLASLYSDMGDYKAAEPYFKQALEIHKKALGEEHPDYAMILTNLACLYSVMDDYKAAEPYFKEASEIYKKSLGEEHPEYASCLNNLAIFYKDMNDYKTAEFFYKLAFDIKQTSLKRAFTWLSAQEKEKFWHKEQGFLKSINSFSVKAVYSTPSSTVLSYQSNLLSKSLLLETSRELDQVITQSGDSALKAQFTEMKQLRRAYNKMQSEGSDKREIMDRYNLQADSLDKILVNKLGEYAASKRKFEITWKDVQSNLSSSEAAIEYARYFDDRDSIYKYMALIIRPTYEYPKLVKLGKEDDIVLANQPKAQDFSALYDLIWESTDSLLSGVKTIYYSPTGELNNISFNALCFEASDSLLVTAGSAQRGEELETASSSTHICNSVLMDKYTMHQLTTTRYLADGTLKKNRPLNYSITLAGGINYDDIPATEDNIHREESDEDFALNVNLINRGSKKIGQRDGNGIGLPKDYLKGTKEEVMQISNHLNEIWSVQTYSGSGASENILKMQLEKESPGVLHIATHGFAFPDAEGNDSPQPFNEERPSFNISEDPMVRCGLMLSGSNISWTGNQRKMIESTGDDGIFTAAEVSNMDLSQTKLVVLSACETGLGKIEGSEGTFGLKRGFKLAGVEQMIVSLWSVPDKETMELMNLFYTDLTKTLNPVISFEKAQKEMRNKYPTEPEKWAGFVLVR
jgi:tetratricopeptide (TPR) repeat protein